MLHRIDEKGNIHHVPVYLHNAQGVIEHPLQRMGFTAAPFNPNAISHPAVRLRRALSNIHPAAVSIKQPG